MPTDVPAIGVSFKHTLDDYREVVFQGYIPANGSADHFNDMLDMLSAASDRLKAKAHLPTIRGLLEIKRAALITETNNLFLAESERSTQSELWQRQAQESGRRSWKPTPAQSQDHAKIQARVAQSEQSIAVLKKEIDTYERQLADMETKLGTEG